MAEVEPDADEEAEVGAGDGGIEVVEDFGCLQQCELAMCFLLENAVEDLQQGRNRKCPW